MAARRRSRRHLILLGVDILIILAGLNLAHWFRSRLTLLNFLSFHYVALVIALIIAYLLSFSIFDFYNPFRRFNTPDFLTSIGGAFGLAYAFAIASFYVFPYKLGRGVFLISWVITAALVYAWRYAFSAFFRLSEPRRNVLIIGNGASTESVVPALKNDPEFRLAAIMDKKVLKEQKFLDGKTAGRQSLEEYVALNKIDDIVISLDADSVELERALVNCRMKGVACHTFEAFYERLFAKLPVLMLNDRWFLMSGGFETLGNRFYQTIKRATDIAVACSILIISLPISLVVTILIPLSSKGPAFFTQTRLGESKKPFKIIKFRTMVWNAEADGPQWARNGDERVTKLGGFLRRTRLDEIPQFINVLRGHMSLIGPRPEREYFVTYLTEKIPFYGLRFFVKPGITGWAQVNFRYGLDEEDALEKLRYELYYIKNQSLVLDARILKKTVQVVLSGQGT